MLAETEAWALLEQFCGPLQSAMWTDLTFRHHNCSDDARKQVDLIVQATPKIMKTVHEAQLSGARLRLALGVAQAVSFCRGYEPASHQQFWRRVVRALWPGSSHVSQYEMLAFSPRCFAHVGIEWTRWSDVDNAFWLGFYHGNAADNATLTAVLHQLRPHFVAGAPPPLRVSLSQCISRLSPRRRRLPPSTLPYSVEVHPLVDPVVVTTIVRAMLEASPSPSSCSLPLHLGLVVEYRIGGDVSATHAILDVVAHTQTWTPPLLLTYDRLVIQLTPPSPPQLAGHDACHRHALVARGRALGPLLRRLLADESPSAAHVPVVVLKGCSWTDFRLVGAALSAVAQAVRPIESLRCAGLCDASQPRHRLLRLAWLAYVLHRRRRGPCHTMSLFLLSIGVAMNQEETESIQQLVARGTPLRDVAAEAVRLRFGDDVASLARLKVQWAQLGSTVRLAPTTRLFFEPFRADEASVAVTMPWCSDLGHECDVVARVTFDEADGRSLAWLGVVYAGYGLVWAHQSGVTAWQPADDSRGGACVLSSLAFSFHGQWDLPLELAETFRISAMLPLLTCATLETLSMVRAVVTRDDLAHMLAVCPRLEALVLDRCVVECLDPLVDAYRQKRARVAVLSLRGTFDLRLHAMLVDRQPMLVSSLHGYRRDGDAPVWISPLVEALASGVARSVLRELHLDCRAMRSEHDEHTVLELLAQAIASSSLSLWRLHVTCRRELQGTCAALFGPLRGAVLADPLRVQRALLSVLRVFAYGLPEIARLVLALAEGGVVRTITWDSLVHS